MRQSAAWSGLDGGATAQPRHRAQVQAREAGRAHHQPVLLSTGCGLQLERRLRPPRLRGVSLLPSAGFLARGAARDPRVPVPGADPVRPGHAEALRRRRPGGAPVLPAAGLQSGAGHAPPARTA